VRDVHLSAAIDPAHTPDGAAAGTTREGRTLMLTLTATGAREWTRAVKREGAVKGSVRLTYEYPQLLPRSTAAVTIGGARVHACVAGKLHLAPDGTLYGSLDEVHDAWASLVRVGAVSIVLTEAPDVVDDRNGLLARLSEQAREQLLDVLFEPYAPASSATGVFRALRWKRPADAIDFTMSISVEGWTWLKASLEADLMRLLGTLDESYIHTTYEAVSVPVSLVVEPAPAASRVAVSLDFGAGRPPEAPVFDATGGTRQFLVTSERPDTIKMSYRATVSFTPSDWPIVETVGAAGLTDGYRIVLRPQSWIRRHTMYLYVRRGNRIVPQLEADPADYLTITATYRADYLPQPIRAGMRITPQGPIEFSYPIPPGQTAGRATVTLLGIVGGQMVRTAELALEQPDDAVYFLVDGSRVQIVARNVVMNESDALAQRLRSGNGRPVISDRAPITSEDSRDLDVQTDLVLIPQPTDVTCWAASLAMVVSARDRASTDPQRVASRAGMDVNTGYGWDDIRRAVSAWDLIEEGPQSTMPDELARWLETWGPIWVVEIGAPYHAVVLAGVRGDGTPEGTYVTVYNPWPPGVGAIETKTFLDFENEFGLGAGAGAAMVHA
jgi:hypothetical protein